MTDKQDVIVSLLKEIDKNVENLGGSGGSGGGMIETTWVELKALRDNSQLVPGQQYRITDYVATTSDPESRSANHPFDILVVADDERTLNENARAIAHEGDTYFERCNLSAWKLKYCLDNDIIRFSWAQKGGECYNCVCKALGINITLQFVTNNDTFIENYPYKFECIIQNAVVTILTPQKEFSTLTTCYMYYDGIEPTQVPIDNISKVIYEEGKGVIYYMVDESNNKSPFDFKGIQFKRYIVNQTVNEVEILDSNIISEISELINLNNYNWYYAFTNPKDYSDCSMKHKNVSTSYKNCTISEYFDNLYFLPNIVIACEDGGRISDSAYVQCDMNCHNVTINDKYLWRPIILKWNVENVYINGYPYIGYSMIHRDMVHQDYIYYNNNH